VCVCERERESVISPAHEKQLLAWVNGRTIGTEGGLQGEGVGGEALGCTYRVERGLALIERVERGAEWQEQAQKLLGHRRSWVQPRRQWEKVVTVTPDGAAEGVGRAGEGERASDREEARMKSRRAVSKASHSEASHAAVTTAALADQPASGPAGQRAARARPTT